MKKEIKTTELVEVNGEIIRVTRHYDETNGRLQERLDNKKGKNISTTNSRPGGFGIIGSVRVWMDYRAATKEQRKADAYENLKNAESENEYRDAQEAIEIMEWGERMDKIIADCSDYQGSVPLNDGY